MHEYLTAIGLETHAELSTDTKIFCNCKNRFGESPNTNVCPVCMGLPGALPTVNRTAVEYAVVMGHALNCKINLVSRFDRKNYLYPDLPKSYQISQSYVPICVDGWVDFWYNGEVRHVRIERIHIEEDAGKLIHNENSEEITFVDLNRCGVPLIEIVTKPDIRSPGEAAAYLKTIRSILTYLDICDCKMQEGSLRSDVNVSLNLPGEPLGVRCEMKNINSFSAVTRAAEYEIDRQRQILDSGGKIQQQTRRWDDLKRCSFLMRTKENADDYRYFPEPDIPPVEISIQRSEELKNSIGELANVKLIRYITKYRLNEKDAQYICSDPELASFFDRCVQSARFSPQDYSRRIMSELAKYLNDTNKSFEDTKLDVKRFNDLMEEVDKGSISNSAFKKAFIALAETDFDVKKIINDLGLLQLADENELERIAERVLKENPKSADDYKRGKTNALGYLMGQCMKISNGKANPVRMKEILLSHLAKK